MFTLMDWIAYWQGRYGCSSPSTKVLHDLNWYDGWSYQCGQSFKHATIVVFYFKNLADTWRNTNSVITRDHAGRGQSRPTSPKVSQIVATSVFTEKVKQFEIAHKFVQYLDYFFKKMSPYKPRTKLTNLVTLLTTSWSPVSCHDHNHNVYFGDDYTPFKCRTRVRLEIYIFDQYGGGIFISIRQSFVKFCHILGLFFLWASIVFSVRSFFPKFHKTSIRIWIQGSSNET